jgi:hypothetical protein
MQFVEQKQNDREDSMTVVTQVSIRRVCGFAVTAAALIVGMGIATAQPRDPNGCRAGIRGTGVADESAA